MKRKIVRRKARDAGENPARDVPLMGDPDYLICCRVGDPLRAHVPSFQDYCSFCGHPVLRAYSSPEDIKAICLECVRQKDPGDVEIRAQTPKQRRDVDAYNRRQQN
jgi:hypothetical protein